MDYSRYLFSGDIPVAQIRDGRVVPLDKSQMPLYLAKGGDFEEWLRSRAIDRHRTNSRILKKVLRLTDSSDLAAVLYPLCFKDYRLFRLRVSCVTRQ